MDHYPMTLFRTNEWSNTLLYKNVWHIDNFIMKLSDNHKLSIWKEAKNREQFGHYT